MRAAWLGDYAMKTWKLKRTRQCSACPWRKDVDPNDIPNGYTEERHRALESTIAREGDLSGVFSGELRIMACHELHDAHCIGWMVNQLGPGNNIGLRIHIRNCSNANLIRTIGEQHKTFEETLT